MNFTTLEFSIFFFAFFVLYWFVFNKDLKQQNILILLSSYLFYGWWDWRFLILIFISSLVDFLVGKTLDQTEKASHRKWLLYLSLGVNLGMLGFFKYFNFFLENFKIAFGIIDTSVGFTPLDIILPIGISFYTLQTLSYTIDVYDRKTKATNDFVSFFAYVSFFPQLVAGPIERARQLLPQFQQKRVFEYDKAADGLRQVLWGLFKKMVIADNCASYSQMVTVDYAAHDGSTLLLGLFLTIFQFYCDFSGYSDIAIGTARMLGFDLMKNFDFPFFSRNMSELWQKWHISLITWFRDYIIRRLKGFTKVKIVRNIFIIFLITGFWHGAKWTLIFWGILHAAAFLPLVFVRRKKYRHTVAKNKLLPSLNEVFAMMQTFLIFSFIGVFFSIATVYDGFMFLKGIFNTSLFTIPVRPETEAIIGILFLLIIEWLQREKEHGLDYNNLNIPTPIRWGLYFSLVFIILAYGGGETNFIYFQF